MIKEKNNIKYWLCISISFLILITGILYYFQTRNISTKKEYQITLTDVGFDTPITFSAQCTQSEFDKYVGIVRKTSTENNKRFDAFHEYEGINNVYTLNVQAFHNPVEVDDTLLHCIQLALNIGQNASTFDITQGNLLNIWHTYRDQSILLNDKGKNGVLPSQNEIDTALKHAGQQYIQINNHKIRFLDSDVKIDLGGIAKGYTAQLCKEKLNKKGLYHGFINAGGNVVTLGKKDNNHNWNIGLQNPNSQDSLLSLEVNGAKAIVTSGDYQRYFVVNDVSYNHVIDPNTGWPAKKYRSVTIITDDSGLADGLSTALFCLDMDDGQALIEKYKSTYNIDIDAIWITDAKKDSLPNSDYKTDSFNIYCTKNIKNKIHLNT